MTTKRRFNTIWHNAIMLIPRLDFDGKDEICTNGSSVLLLSRCATDGVMLKPRSESAPAKRSGTNAIEGDTKNTY